MKLRNNSEERNLQNATSDDALFTLATLNTEKIIYFRTTHRLTQKEFADLVGVTPVTIGRWEKHVAFPSKTHFKKLTEVLQVDSKDLIIFSGSGDCYEGKGVDYKKQRGSSIEVDPQHAASRILPLFFEAHNLISECISIIDKESELKIFESILNNSLILVRSQIEKIEKAKLCPPES